MRRLIAMIVTLAALAGAATALGFGTITKGNTIHGQDAEHERITRRAVACPGPKSDGVCWEAVSLTQLAGTGGTFGAVGIPDVPPADDADYHCDDGDYLSVPGYPQSAAKAQAAIAACRRRMVQHMNDAVADAAALLDAKDRIIPAQVDLSSACSYTGQISGRAKCNVIEAFGITLHVSQDFYSHTNWVDRPAAGAVNATNPPGLGNSVPAPYIDLRGDRPFPAGLISGCFGQGPVKYPGRVLGIPEYAYCNYGFAGRLNRVKHRDLNKDKGPIDPTIGTGRTGRGGVAGNFARAVTVAIADTSDKWATLREKLIATYGNKRGALMICAIVRDDPVKDCQGRVVGLVIDSSGSNTTTDPGNLRITAGLALATNLVSTADAAGEGTPDTLAVIDFDATATVVYPLGDPDGAAAAIRGIDSSGSTHIAGGIQAALTAMTPVGPPPGKSGIVVLTDGEDSDVAALIAAINQATARGVRVSFGFLSPPTTITSNEKRAAAREHVISPDLQNAIIASGGVFATIRSAAEQQTFVQLVEQRGVTALDDPDGADDGGALAPGVEVAGSFSSASDADTWTFALTAGQGVKVTLTPPSAVTGTVRLTSPEGGVATVKGTGAGAVVTASASSPAGGLLTITVQGDGTGVYTLKLEADAAAPVLVAPRPRAVTPRTRVVGNPRVSIVRGGRTVKRIPFGRTAYVVWKIRTKGALLILHVRGPGGVHKKYRLKLPAGLRTVTGTLPVVGKRRGVWSLELLADGRLIAQTALRTR
ncbi:MAG: vWA domain-containing protein [Actinomycetota bacterium]